MADLRMQYLDFKEVETAYNSDDFKASQTSSLLEKLAQILDDAIALGERFLTLDKGSCKILNCMNKMS